MYPVGDEANAGFSRGMRPDMTAVLSYSP